MDDFEWDDANIRHVGEHGLTPEEVEEAILDPDRRRRPAYRGPKGERRSGLLGATEDGLVVVVIYTKRKGRIRVVTAYPGGTTERREYNARRRRR